MPTVISNKTFNASIRFFVVAFSSPVPECNIKASEASAIWLTPIFQTHYRNVSGLKTNALNDKYFNLRNNALSIESIRETVVFEILAQEQLWSADVTCGSNYCIKINEPFGTFYEAGEINAGKKNRSVGNPLLNIFLRRVTRRALLR
ncbi:hypothetical protein AVEN_133933-1 [Araneus ventricosus]|uniref:Uncharacterized protein n=1 Tax=Araneus ventricosus TaxID=182803 RepID=A0A4Y2D522_ARAVE|nr:hypothetical protein AVEN_133933-1 [Araneus ventricosus]